MENQAYIVRVQRERSRDNLSGQVRVSPGGRSMYIDRAGQNGQARVFEGRVTWSGFDALPYDVDAEVSLTGEAGELRVEVSALTLRPKPGGPPLGGRAIQNARLGSLILRSIELLTKPVDHKGRVRLLERSSRGDAKAAASLTPAPQRVALEVLRRTAKLYRDAQRKGKPTGQYVAGGLGVSPRLARNRISQARREGLLPPAGGTTRPRLEAGR
jgi:hypothetical protein